MKTIKSITILLITILAVFLITPTAVLAAPPEDGRTVLGETYILEEGRILEGDLTVIGGVVEIKAGATVSGNVFILGGLVTIDGTVEGDLSAIGGTVNLEEHAVIRGDLYSPASFINRDAEAVVMGNELDTWNIPGMDIELPSIAQPTPRQTTGSRVLSIITWIGREITLIFLMSGLGALLLLVMPQSAERMSQALNAAPWTMLGFGALSAVAMAVGGVILAITICLIPFVIVIGLAFGLAWLVGWLTLGYELGKRIATGIFKAKWHPVLTGAVGNLVLYLVARSLDLIPCIGGFLVFFAGLFGLGMAVVTLIGTRPYPQDTGEEFDQPVVLFTKEEE